MSVFLYSEGKVIKSEIIEKIFLENKFNVFNRIYVLALILILIICVLLLYEYSLIN